jgi:hypothetical protein
MPTQEFIADTPFTLHESRLELSGQLSYQIFVIDDDGAESVFGIVTAQDFGSAIDFAKEISASTVSDAVLCA